MERPEILMVDPDEGHAKAYAGITGFKTKQEVLDATRIYSDNGYLSTINWPNTSRIYQPMFGFLVSTKRLSDKSVGGTKSPPANDLAMLASHVPRGALSMMHYHTKNRTGLAEEVKEVFSIGKMYERGYCRALQINMPWPDVEQVDRIKQEFPEMAIVLQLPPDATSGRENDEIVRRAKEYEPLITYVLYDTSAGKGRLTDFGKSLELLSALECTLQNTTLAVAGGLSGENVKEQLKALEKLNRRIGVDAEGRLRTQIPKSDETVLDMIEVKDYLGNIAVYHYERDRFM